MQSKKRLWIFFFDRSLLLLPLQIIYCKLSTLAAFPRENKNTKESHWRTMRRDTFVRVKDNPFIQPPKM